MGVAAASGAAELANTLGMLSLGSPFWVVTAAYLALPLAALVLTLAPSFAFSSRE